MGKLIRAALRIGGATVLVCALVAVSDQILAPAQPSSESAANDLLAGHSFYYAGQPRRALEAYRSAIARDPKRLSAWLNGAVVWAELGELAEASAWYRNALALNPESARIATALAEVELHRGQFDRRKRPSTTRSISTRSPLTPGSRGAASGWHRDASRTPSNPSPRRQCCSRR